MMNAQKRNPLLIALLLGAGIAVAGCDRPPTSDSANKRTDKSTSKVVIGDTTGTSATTPGSTSKEVVDDSAITTKVKAAILAEPGLHSMDIGVDTSNAVVTLTGTVDSPPLKDRAKQVASSVSGVKSVVDNLTTTKSG